MKSIMTLQKIINMLTDMYLIVEGEAFSFKMLPV